MKLQQEIKKFAKEYNIDVQFKKDGTLYKKSLNEFKDKVNWGWISEYQKLSKAFRDKFNLKTYYKTNWLYKTTKSKLKYIKENTNYKVIDNKYIEAYKSIRTDNYSVFNFQYKYEVGKWYESTCDCNINEENSFGLSAWTKDKAKEYYNKGKLIKVLIPIKDIGAIVHDNKKIRCFRLKVLKEIS